MDCLGRARRANAFIACITLIVGLHPEFCAAAATPRLFDIPAGPAIETLLEFGHQADLQVYLQYDDVHGSQTRAVKGRMSADAALQSMLKESGLSYQPVDERTISVFKRDSRAEANSGSRDSRLPRRPLSVLDTSTPSPEVTVAANRGLGDVEHPPGVELIRITAANLQKAGIQTAADALRTLPFNFGGGPGENTTFGREAVTNTAFGTGANLYGLGSRATLILVNGRRLAPSGSSAMFTDVSNIPASAIDHIEILNDATATLYGSDAIGGVINYVLRGDPSNPASQANFGHIFRGSLGEQQFGQSLGHAWDRSTVVLAVEYYERDALFASERGQATSDLTPWHGQNLGTWSGAPGTIVDANGQVWGIPAGQNGVGLKSSDLIAGTPNYHDLFQDSTILPRQHRISAYGNLVQKVSDDGQLTFNALFSRRHFESQQAALTTQLQVPKDNPFYVRPDGYVGTPDDNGAVTVDYGFRDDVGPLRLHGRVETGQFVLGFEKQPYQKWRISSYLGYAFERQRNDLTGLIDFAALQSALDKTQPDEAFNPFGDGIHNSKIVRDEIQVPGTARYDSAFRYFNVTAAGPIPSFLHRPASLTVGSDYRLQTFSSHIEPAYFLASPETDRKRTVLSAFTQLDVPILRGNDVGGQRTRLDVSLGARYEHYSDVGQAFSPRFSFAFYPWHQLALRGSWTRLFRAPSLSDLTESNNVSALFTLADPSSTTGYTTALVWSGNNPNLRPESAKSWSLGLTYSPKFVSNLSVSLNYYDFVFTNRIAETTDLPLNVLADPSLSWLVMRHVSPTEQARVCGRSQFIGLPADCTGANVGALVDMRLRNIQALKTNGLDFALRYQFTTPVGLFKYGFDSTYVLRYAQGDTPTSPVEDIRNTPHNPPVLRSRTGLEWNLRRMWIATFINYQSGYYDRTMQRPVGSWTTVDSTVGIIFPDRDLLSSGETRISLRGSNILNRNPPVLLDAIGLGYDHENANLRGRALSIGLQRRW